MITLRGMTWDHERGIAPLLRASTDFKQLHPEVSAEWDARSLSDFEQYPLEQLAERYDLIMIDHPHLGTAADQQLLIPMDELVPAVFLAEQKLNSVGQSHESYYWQDRQWALAVDAAAQISAYRPDLLALAGTTVPRTWEDVRALAAALPEGIVIGLPLVPVHAYASYFTLTSQIGRAAFWSNDMEVPAGVGIEAFRLLRELYTLAHPESVHSDPIAMYERMATTDQVAYVPLMYGYSNYSQTGFRPQTVHCADIPSGTGQPEGSMIGGVGIAVSSKCAHPEIAAAYAMMIATGSYQSTTFFESGGQPGHRSAWTDTRVNEQSSNFFASTLRTLDLGTVRPRFDGYIEFQERAGQLIQQCIMDETMVPEPVVSQLNRMLKVGLRA